MTRLFSCLWIAAFALLLGACTNHVKPAPTGGTTATTASTPRAPVLLVSIDGYRTDYLKRKQSPALTALAASGVRAKWMQPSFPSLTFPNHYTLVTGKYPDHHGIIHNSMYDRKLGRFSLGREEAVTDGHWWDEAEPVWVTADKHGLTTATMFWPGSEAEIHGHRPDYWLPYNGDFTAGQRVDQVLAWLDLPADQRPDFLTLYFDHVDHAGHEYGPDTPEVNRAIRHVDHAISQLVTGLKARGLFDKINIVVVSDHGMAAVPEGNQILIDKLIDLEHVHIVSMGVLAGFNLKPKYADDVRKALLQEHSHMRCWEKGHFPARFHYGHNPRTPDISCLADVHWSISDSVWLAKRTNPPARGQHGYDVASPLMRALFIAHGPAFRHGVVIDGFPNVDVYALLAQLLDIPALPGDGSLEAFQSALHKTTAAPDQVP